MMTQFHLEAKDKNKNNCNSQHRKYWTVNTVPFEVVSYSGMNGVDFSYRKVFYCKKVDKKFKPGSPDFLNPKLENMVDFYEDNGLEYLKPI